MVMTPESCQRKAASRYIPSLKHGEQYTCSLIRFLLGSYSGNDQESHGAPAGAPNGCRDGNDCLCRMGCTSSNVKEDLV